jgi:aconitate hydratase
MTRKTLDLDGSETFTIRGLKDIQPRQDVTVEITRADGTREDIVVTCRIDTLDELSYMHHGGILPYVLRNLAAAE